MTANVGFLKAEIDFKLAVNISNIFNDWGI
jgi:hypothetical protein